MARTTIKDVAKLSGCSIATVSLIINNRDVNISKEMRERVWNAVQTLNYRQNQLAVSLVKKQSKVIGLLIPDNSNGFFADMSKYIECSASRYGYNLIYGNTNNSPKRTREYMQVFIDRQIDGIIFSKAPTLDGGDEQDLKDCIVRASIPFISIDRPFDHELVKTVLLNNFRGGYLATQHLIRLGHRRIGAYTGPFQLADCMERLAGYRAALEESGLCYDPALVFEGNYQLGKEEEALARFLQGGATAIFCFNDLMAAGLYKVLRKERMQIPRDMSLVGFDNTQLSDALWPSLTTVRQPIEEMSECAVHLLLNMIEGREVNAEKRIYIFEPELLIRDSAQAAELSMAPAP